MLGASPRRALPGRPPLSWGRGAGRARSHIGKVGPGRHVGCGGPSRRARAVRAVHVMSALRFSNKTKIFFFNLKFVLALEFRVFYYFFPLFSPEILSGA